DPPRCHQSHRLRDRGEDRSRSEIRKGLTVAQPVRISPGPGQESVWDYPRSPRVEDSSEHVRVVFGGVVIAETRRAKRVLERSSPPTYYIPPEDVRRDLLVETSRV